MLPELQSLETLFLRDAGIGVRGAVSMAGTLPRCKRLTDLDLSHNAIGDAGAIAIAEAIMKDGVALKHLSLATQCPVTEIIGEARGTLVPLRPAPIPATVEDSWQYAAVHFPHLEIPGLGDEATDPPKQFWDVLTGSVIDNRLRVAEVTMRSVGVARDARQA